jgi:hypothetical protein
VAVILAICVVALIPAAIFIACGVTGWACNLVSFIWGCFVGNVGFFLALEAS